MFKTCKKPPMSIISASGDICSFKALQAGIPLKSHTVDIDSVSGVSKIHIQNTCGINLWNEEFLNGYYNRNAQGAFVSDGQFMCSKYMIPVKPNQSLFWYAEKNNQGRILFYDENGVYVSSTENNTPNTVITVPSNCYYLHFYIFISTLGEFNNSINYPSTDTTYHAFEGQSFDISIGQTVNEATYNARTGVLEVTQPTVQTIQLPPCPIEPLLGENNIFADCGSTSIEAFQFGR